MMTDMLDTGGTRKLLGGFGGFRRDRGPAGALRVCKMPVQDEGPEPDRVQVLRDAARRLAAPVPAPIAFRAIESAALLKPLQKTRNLGVILFQAFRMPPRANDLEMIVSADKQYIGAGLRPARSPR